MFLLKKIILYNRNTEGIYIHPYVNNHHIQSVLKNIQKNTTILNEIYKKANFVTDAYEIFKNYLKFIDVNMQYKYKNTLANTTAYQKTLCYYLSKY